MINLNLIKKLNNISAEIRKDIVCQSVKHGGHIASSLSCTDILVALYFGNYFKYDASNPEWPERDRFVLSKGHAEILLYVLLVKTGFIDQSLLDTQYRRNDCILGGHPDKDIPGVEITSGALGHGIGIATGMAHALKMSNSKQRVFSLLGDAECTEGSVWESLMYAAKHNLSNLVCIVDHNKIGSIDFIKNMPSIGILEKKISAFGWEVVSIDGHSHKNILETYKFVTNSTDQRPKMIIANTIKGKGISFMENDPIWHAKQLNEEELIKIAYKELAIEHGK